MKYDPGDRATRAPELIVTIPKDTSASGVVPPGGLVGLNVGLPPLGEKKTTPERLGTGGNDTEANDVTVRDMTSEWPGVYAPAVRIEPCTFTRSSNVTGATLRIPPLAASLPICVAPLPAFPTSAGPPEGTVT